MNRFALAASIVLVLGLVNGTWAAKKERVDTKSLEHLFQRLLNEGEDHTFGERLAKVLDIEPGSTAKAQEIVDDDTADQMAHACQALLKSGKKQKPFCFLLSAGRMGAEETTSYYFKIWPSGMVEDKVVISHGKMQDGQPVRGSAHDEFVTLDAPGMRERLQHELDFWFKGMYRKASQAAEASDGPGLATPASASEVKDAVK